MTHWTSGMRFCLVERCLADTLALSRPGRSESTLSENGFEKTEDQVELSSLAAGMAVGEGLGGR